MASSKPIPCGPCQEEKVNNKADLWCYNCDEGFCSICSGHHKRFKIALNHKTIDIERYIPSIPVIKTECDNHDQQLSLYCPSHSIPCCDDCISTNHSKCTGIKSLASVVEKKNIEKSTQSLEKQMESILHFLDKLINSKSKNISKGEQECESLQEAIVKIRKKVNDDLTQLEEKLRNETDTILNQEKTKAADLITEIEGKQKKLNEMQDHLYTVLSNSSKLQSFLCVHKIEQDVHQCQQYVEDLESDERAKEFDINIRQKDDIEKILSKLLGSLESLGEVRIVKTALDCNRETCGRREAQVQSQEQSNINNMTMNIEAKIDLSIKMMTWVTDMICLMNGRVIVVDENEDKVILLTSDGKLRKQLPLPGEPFNVRQINRNTIAITYPQEKVIKIFNMEDEKVTKVIKLDKHCRGLSFSNNSFAVGLNDNEIRIIDLEGNKLKSIQVHSKTILENIVYSNDRVIYSDYNGQAVHCVDGSGKQIWKYDQDLKAPEGLCTDTYGNIILADHQAHRIILISKDGQDSKVLISDQKDKLKTPNRICFEHNESSGYICGSLGKYLTKFNISSFKN
ncbi:Hypothetical predicted protein [Mytilus galloprovincialis]|uniref:B box-type domain-containing protein n=1 Tax=Mytilus galloprovincialis TaxID=29158 RepID=A0A8B6G661_MYTGA|nr:Hypothetical predicted protein [Mytilus galloprovincialis]